VEIHKIKSALLVVTSFILVSTHLQADLKGEAILSEEVKQQIISDVSITEAALEGYQEDFIDYYIDEISPRISNLEDHILSSALNEIAPDVYVLGTEGLAPSSWGGNEFLYIISTKTGTPKILESMLLDPKPSRTNEGYRLSDFWIKPNTGCGYNDFVGGVLQYGVIGGSGSTFVQIYAEYSRYDNSYSLRQTTSPLRFSKPICID